MADEKVIDEKQVPEVEPVSPESEVTPEVTEPQALTEERVQQLIAEATNKAVVEAKEVGRRELQGQQDKNRAEIERLNKRARLAEGTLGATRSQLQSLDPEAARDIELAGLKAEKAGRFTLDQEDALRQQQEAYGKTLTDALYAHLADLGIDPNDKRLDWAADSANYVQGKSRLDASVAQIIKEERQTMQTGLEKRLKDLEGKMGQVNIEANSVDTAASGGAAAGSDAEFIKKFGAGDLPMAKENVDRYEKIRNNY